MQFQWWCAAQTAAWEWTWRPYPGVWIFIAALAFGYWALLRRAKRLTGETVGGARVASAVAGLLTLWLALDWPIGALGAGYLASMHMVQFLLIGMVAPPLLLWGLPPAALRVWLDGGVAAPAPTAAGSPQNAATPGEAAPPRAAAPPRFPRLARVLRLVMHPLVAIFIFNAIVGATHTPAVNDTLMVTQLGSFAIDIAWLVGGLIFWWPVAAAAPARPNFHPLLKIGYLTALAIAMTPVFLYLTFSDHPVYAVYELAPRVNGIDAHADQRVAGLIMKVVGGFILMGVLSVLFFRWATRTGDDMTALQAAKAGAAETAEPVMR
jgi:cytochrome c oxidase assembly factor CtaG